MKPLPPKRTKNKEKRDGLKRMLDCLAAQFSQNQGIHPNDQQPILVHLRQEDARKIVQNQTPTSILVRELSEPQMPSCLQESLNHPGNQGIHLLVSLINPLLLHRLTALTSQRLQRINDFNLLVTRSWGALNAELNTPRHQDAKTNLQTLARRYRVAHETIQKMDAFLEVLHRHRTQARHQMLQSDGFFWEIVVDFAHNPLSLVQFTDFFHSCQDSIGGLLCAAINRNQVRQISFSIPLQSDMAMEQNGSCACLLIFDPVTQVKVEEWEAVG